MLPSTAENSRIKYSPLDVRVKSASLIARLIQEFKNSCRKKQQFADNGVAKIDGDPYHQRQRLMR